MDHILEQVIGDFQERPLPKLTRREVSLPGLAGKIDTLIGMRRTGKSWRVFQAMGDLLAAGTPKESLLYINLDDERLYPLTADDLQRIPDTFFRLTPQNKQRRCHIFFDEIQNVPGWERFIRRLLDTENAQITLTGSSAKLLSREIATTLRGRSLATEIFPFSFREALRHQGENDSVAKVVGGARRALLSNRLRSYLDSGGFPEVQGIDAPYRIRILQEYVDVVILRDVVERHGIGNLAPLRYLIRHLLGSPACAFSVNRFHNDLKSQGIACGKNPCTTISRTWKTPTWCRASVSIHARHASARSIRARSIPSTPTWPGPSVTAPTWIAVGCWKPWYFSICVDAACRSRISALRRVSRSTFSPDPPTANPRQSR